ncbi:outer membrane protein with beta-barrel domain [Gelidibacter sediminis]|uniref:Outer membrane protein with beta-barrel domain n=1 Tax=Gelidibacter sediminis TaxID=1608710 RepID=A0A4R7PZP2_9FLAO|nr:porin family protein [Gelidibacter sediminis]TDU39769.1 outer membrane protein with beta-barrel domain [Gelidibacter sediminis]
MKKIYLLLSFALFGLATSLTAQNVDFGVKTGLNITTLSGGDADRNNLFSYHIGGLAEIGFSDTFSLQPEVLYSRQGAEAQDIVKVKIDYLAIPLMAKYYVSDHFSIEAGPQFSFLLNDKAEFEDSAIPDAETDAEGFDFGLNIGFGYSINDNLFAQARYSYGVTTVVENPDIKNSVVQFSLGYMF